MLPPLQSSQIFNSHYECVTAGYLEGLQMVQAIGKIEIEKNRLFVAFNCKPEISILLQTQPNKSLPLEL